MTEMMLLHKSLTRRLEVLQDALDTSRELKNEEQTEKNLARWQEVREVLKMMERIDPECTKWEA